MGKFGKYYAKLQLLGNTLLNWFNNNSMKANHDSSKVIIGNKRISSTKCGKLLGIKIDNNLNFKEQIESLCKKSSQKINV